MSHVNTGPAVDRRPQPDPDDTTRFYWEAAADRRLVLQRCRSCDKFQFPPDVCCVHCQSEEFEHVALSGRGSIYSYATVDRPLHAGFVDALPYVVALVELVEQPGLRVLTNIVGTAPGTELHCGMPVEVDFEVRGPVTLPQFRLSGAR